MLDYHKFNFIGAKHSASRPYFANETIVYVFRDSMVFWRV